MSDDTQALSPLSSTSATTDADYDVIHTAFMETGRGRWFLQEYARRNRNADTQVLLMALERIEETIRKERASASFDRIKFDLHEMATAIVRTKAEIAAIRPGDGKLVEAGAELGSIVKTAEAAIHRVLQAAEQVQELAWTMCERGIDPVACDRLDALATEIYLACEFQDLTGQRTGKVIEVLGFLEERITAMATLWGDDEAPPRAERRAAPDMDQSDIDVVMAPPGTRVESGFPVNPAAAARVIDHEPVGRGTGIPDELADALDRTVAAEIAAALTDHEVPAGDAEPAAPVADADLMEAEAATHAAVDTEAEPQVEAQSPTEREAHAGEDAGDVTLAVVSTVEPPVLPDDAVPDPELADAAAALDVSQAELDAAAALDAAQAAALAAALAEPDPDLPTAQPATEMAAEQAPEIAAEQATEVAAEPETEAWIADPIVHAETTAEASAAEPIPDDVVEPTQAEVEPEPAAITAAAAMPGEENAPEEPAAPSPFGAALEQALAGLFETPAPAAHETQEAAEPADQPAEAFEERPVTETAAETPAAIAVETTWVDIETIEPVATDAADVADGAEPALDVREIEAVALEEDAVAEPDEQVEATAATEPASPIDDAAEPVEAAASEEHPDAATERVDEIASEMRALLADWPKTEATDEAVPAGTEPEPLAEPELHAADTLEAPEPAAPETVSVVEIVAEATVAPDVAAPPPEPAAAEQPPAAVEIAAQDELPAPFAEPFMLELWAAEIDETDLAAARADVMAPQAAELDADLFEAAAPEAAAVATGEVQAPEAPEAPVMTAAALADEPAMQDNEPAVQDKAPGVPPDTLAAQDQAVAGETSVAQRPESIDSIANEIRALLAKWDEPDASTADAPTAADARTASAADAPTVPDASEPAEPAAADDAFVVPAAVAAMVEVEPAAATAAGDAEAEEIFAVGVTTAPETAATEPAEAPQHAAVADAGHDGNGKDEELAALLFEPARPAVHESEIVLAVVDGPGAEPAAEATVPEEGDETIWSPLAGALPDWSEGPAPPRKAVEAAFMSATAVSMAAMAEIAGATPARPATSDPLAPVKAMSDEERIALFS